MTLRNLIAVVVCVAASLCLAGFAAAQNATSNPTPDIPAPVTSTAPAIGDLHYEVSSVKGKVRIAKIGTNPEIEDGWSPLKVGQSVVEGTQISVPWRGAVKLVAVPADPPTVIMIERGSLVAFSELGYDKNAAKSRVKLGYGAIRAGVAEGEVRSDMEIECPVATLSKRGTDIFRFEYHDGKWNMSLSPLGRGMIQAIQHRYDGMITGGRGGFGTRSRFVAPGQWVNQQMGGRTIETALFDKIVNINDVFGLQDIELKFNQFYGNGLGFMLVGKDPIELQQDAGQAGSEQTDTNLIAGLTGNNALQDMLTLALGRALTRLREQSAIRNNTGGDFGVGQGVITGVFGRNPVGGLRTRMPDMQRARAKMNLMNQHGNRKGR